MTQQIPAYRYTERDPVWLRQRNPDRRIHPGIRADVGWGDLTDQSRDLTARVARRLALAATARATGDRGNEIGNMDRALCLQAQASRCPTATEIADFGVPFTDAVLILDLALRTRGSLDAAP